MITKKRILGSIVVYIPFIIFGWLGAGVEGLKITAIVFAILACVVIGAWLIVGD